MRHNRSAFVNTTANKTAGQVTWENSSPVAMAMADKAGKSVGPRIGGVFTPLTPGVGRGRFGSWMSTAVHSGPAHPAEIMQKSHSKKAGNGVRRIKSLKLRLGGRRKNGYVHVTRPGTVSEIRRTLGIKPSHIRNVLRAFKAAGVEL